MTNKESWDLLTKDLPSHQSWLDLTFLGMISAALERRVWYGSGGREIFCNLFIAIVGPPGSGKTMATNEVKRILHGVKDEQKQTVEDGALVRAPYFTTAPDTTTFEGSLADMSKHTKFFTHEGKKRAQVPYLLLLSELNSYIRLDHTQIPKALLKFYDCENYEYKPKHGSPDIIRNSCVTIIGGATMQFLRDGYDKGIFDDGFAARFVWSFESGPSNRPVNFELCELSDEQIEARKRLIAWVEKLTKVSGKLTYSAATGEFLQNWFAGEHQEEKASAPDYMQYYMSRKGMHLRKLAACIHFSENDSMEISQESFERALALLKKLEPGLAAFVAVGRNPLIGVYRKAVDYIRGRDGVTREELLLQFMSDFVNPRRDVDEMLVVLCVTNKINLIRKNGKELYYASR